MKLRGAQRLAALVHRKGLTRDELTDVLGKHGFQETQAAGTEWFWYEFPGRQWRQNRAQHAIVVVQFYAPAADIDAWVLTWGRYGWVEPVPYVPHGQGYVRTEQDALDILGPVMVARQNLAAVALAFDRGFKVSTRELDGLRRAVRENPDDRQAVRTLVDLFLELGVEF